MLVIGRMPRKLKRLFTPVRDRFVAPAFAHFWRLVLAITIGHRAPIDRLTRLWRGATPMPA